MGLIIDCCQNSAPSGKISAQVAMAVTANSSLLPRYPHNQVVQGSTNQHPQAPRQLDQLLHYVINMIPEAK